MAQWNKKTQDYLNQERTLHEVVMMSDGFGNIGPAYDVGGRSAFGEAAVSEITPVIQLDGLYGIGEGDDFVINQAGTGSASVNSDGLFNTSSGTGTGAFCTLRSRRTVRYRPGEGSIVRFTAMFPNGHVPGYQQAAGYINQTDILGVGFNYGDPAAGAKGNQFGTLRRYNSQGELWKIQVTSGTTASGSIDVTLNGVVFNVPIPAGTLSAQQVAHILAAFTYTQWITDVSGDTCYFLYNGPPVDLPGTFDAQINTGATGFTSTNTTLQNGNPPTDTFIYQEDFNVDKLDGTGPSGMILDTSKLNVFQIDFRWLGAGVIRYAVEDEKTGQLIPFHLEHYVNKNTRSHLSNPSMRIGYGSVNVAPGIGTGVDVVVNGGSIMGAISGKVAITTTSRAIVESRTNLALNDTHHILTIKSDRVDETGTLGKLQQREIILQEISLGALANAGNIAEFYIYKNAGLDDGAGTDVPFLYDPTQEPGVSKSSIVGEYKAGTGKLITGFVVSAGSTDNINLLNYRIILAPLERVSIFVKCPAQVSPHVALTYQVE